VIFVFANNRYGLKIFLGSTWVCTVTNPNVKRNTQNLSPLRLTPGSVVAKHGDELLDLVLLLLKNTFRDPDQVTDLLFLEFDVRVKHGNVELTLKSELQHLHITLVKCVIDTLVARPVRMNVPDGRVLREEFQHTTKFRLVSNIDKHSRSGRIKVADGGVEALAVRHAHGGLVQGSTERVESNVDRVGICSHVKDRP
jgi:hypothetical protein